VRGRSLAHRRIAACRAASYRTIVPHRLSQHCDIVASPRITQWCRVAASSGRVAQWCRIAASGRIARWCRIAVSPHRGIVASRRLAR
jgi:hypothetical protein